MNSKVSVIVPVYNDSERLRICLQALENQTYPEDQYEVIVVDNASDEHIDELVNQFNQAVLIYEDRKGSYCARNKGLSIAKGDIIAFTDSDCIPAPDWIEKGVARLLGIPNCGLVAGKIKIFFKDPNHPTAVELYQSVTAFPQKRYVEINKYGATANVFTFKKVIEDVGNFNDQLKSGGDVEWGRRVFASGYKLIYAEDTQVDHPARDSLKELYKMFTRVTDGHIQLRDKVFDPSIKLEKKPLKSISSPFNRIIDLFKNNNMKGTRYKIKVVFVMVMVRFFGYMEKARLFLGGETRR